MNETTPLALQETPPSRSEGTDARGPEVLSASDLTTDREKLDASIARDVEAAETTLSQVVINKLDGCAREALVGQSLTDVYPEADGYTVQSECCLRTEDGRIALDPDSGEYRRVDFCVVKDGEVIDSVEVTSLDASKEAQSEKEARIREAGGNFIRLDGQLVAFRPDVTTRIERLP